MLQHPTEASFQGHVSSSSSAHACRAHSLVLECCDQWRCPRVLRPPSCTNAPPATAKPPTSDRKCGERKVKTGVEGTVARQPGWPDRLQQVLVAWVSCKIIFCQLALDGSVGNATDGYSFTPSIRFPWTTEDRKRWCRRDRRCTTWPTRPDGYYQRRWPRMAAAFGRATCATRRRSATGLQFQAYWGTTRHNGERPSNRSYAEPTSSSHLASAVQRWRNTRPVVDRPAVPIASESTFGVLPVVSIGPQSRVSLHPTHLDGRTLGGEPP